MTYFKVEDTPLVSVILITYNRECFLKETIDSILAQTYRNFELIIIDNFSDYDFNALVNSYHSNKIRAFQNQNNGIIAINRNFGIERARGNYLAFVMMMISGIQINWRFRWNIYRVTILIYIVLH